MGNQGGRWGLASGDDDDYGDNFYDDHGDDYYDDCGDDCGGPGSTRHQVGLVRAKCAWEVL